MKTILAALFCLFSMSSYAQLGSIVGKVRSGGKAVSFATIGVEGTTHGTVANDNGDFTLKNIKAGTQTLVISAVGFEKQFKRVQVKPNTQVEVTIELEPDNNPLQEVTISAGQVETSKLNSPIPIEVYSPKFFRKNISTNIFESLGMINGVLPTMNCNVCNTGDIHINGMEGPYTLILIDGMPIVSSLSTVYGLMGIPNSMVERIEVMKGPASALYGSEAMAGIINVITKQPSSMPRLTAEVFTTTYNERNVDVAAKFNTTKAAILLSANYYAMQNIWDKNHDNFTDVTLQHRISLFNKYAFKRKSNKEASIAFRLFYEDRWGGETQWNKNFRGGDSVYGESIFTKRAELIGVYDLPTISNLKLMYSYNWHNQNSFYGTTPFMATQQVGFVQLVHQTKWKTRHQILSGITARATWYDDNTIITQTPSGHNKTILQLQPGLFVQDEVMLNSTQTLLLGARADYYQSHGMIYSPRVNYKYQPNPRNTLRISVGNGFRVVNVFTEDHAALTGARQVIIASNLEPEKSINTNLNYSKFISTKKGYINLDGGLFYNYFTNRIIADYDSDPNKIFYNNLNGYAISRGVNLNADITFSQKLKCNIGSTWMQVFKVEKNGLGLSEKSTQLHAPQLTSNIQLSYTFPKQNITIDYTAQVYSPMRLPVLPNDFRPEYSPWFSLHNVQVTKKWNNNWQSYIGVKNLFNFMPQNPIMRPFDPFDKQVNTNNPNSYTFDPSYNYAPLQGVRLMVGVRYQWI